MKQTKIPRLVSCNISRHLSTSNIRHADETEDKKAASKLDLAKPKKKKRVDLSKKAEIEQAPEER